MENASKALIIAGAILVSILLISVGIIIMNAINEPVQQGANSAASQAIEIFNSKFTSYAGEQKGTTVRQLINTIQSSNGADKDHPITYTGPSLGTVKTTSSYNVDFTFADTGYITTITVTAVVPQQNP